MARELRFANEYRGAPVPVLTRPQRSRVQLGGLAYDRWRSARASVVLDVDPDDFDEWRLEGDIGIEWTSSPNPRADEWRPGLTSRGWVGAKYDARHPEQPMIAPTVFGQVGSEDEAALWVRPWYRLNRPARLDARVSVGMRESLIDAHHSIAYTGGDSNGALNTTSVTISAFTTSGSDRVVYPRACWNDATLGDVSTATYGGTTLGAEIGGILGDSNRMAQVVHRRIAPATAASDIVFTLDSNQDSLLTMVTAYSGVDQTTPNRTPETQEGTAADIDDTITSASGELVESGVQCFEGATTADGTSRQQEVQSSDWNLHAQTVAGAASTAVGFTAGASTPYTLVSQAIQPALAGGLSIPVADHHHARNRRKG